MKARLLKKLLNDTGYSVSNHKNYIAVGSPLCHDLMTVDKKTLKVKYALDILHEGRKCLENKDYPELLFIWDKLHELIATGEIQDIINGNDVIENPLPVWTFEDGKLIESHTDKYGWPNTTYEGYTMYENTYFDTKEKAIEKGLSEYTYGLKHRIEQMSELVIKLQEQQQRLETIHGYVEHFKALKEKL